MEATPEGVVVLHGICSSFAWQEGYVFSVSAIERERVRRYIATQEEHHRKVDYVSELRRMLEDAAYLTWSDT